MIHLGSTWRAVLRKAWSIRLAVLAAVFSTAELILPMFVREMPPALFGSLAIACSLGSILARIAVQDGLK